MSESQESNFIVVDNKIYKEKFEEYLKNRNFDFGETFTLSRKPKEEERYLFKVERAFILTENFFLDQLIGHIEDIQDQEKGDRYKINVLYMHRRFLDKQPQEPSKNTKKILDAYENIKIKVHTGGAYERMDGCPAERVEEEAWREIQSKLHHSMGWQLDKYFHCIEELEHVSK